MPNFESEVHKQKVTANHIINFLVNTKKMGQDNLTPDALQNRLNLLESYWTGFYDRQLTICAHKEYPESGYSQTNLFEEVESAYTIAQTQIQQMLKQCSPSTPVQQTQSSGSTVMGKLPKITLPTFSGDPLLWESFKDLFTSLVHDAPGLSDVVRLQYLKASLTGEAARAISSISVTDANYRNAWETLVSRYDNKRLILRHHFHNLMRLKPITTESATELRTLLDTTIETRRALTNMERPVSQWGDDFFVYFTTQRLPGSLNRDWENSLGDVSYIPSFDELNQFLANRLSTMEVTSTPLSRRPRPEIRVHQTKTKPSSSVKNLAHSSQNCAFCKKNHQLCYCPDFKQNSVSKRRDFVTQLRLCFNCLRDHPVAACQSAHRCHFCGANHHTLLHPDSQAHSPTQSVSSSHAYIRHPTLLATALVKVTGLNGKTTVIRALLDQGSEVTFISEDLTQRLRLPRTKIHVPVTGLAATRCGTVKAVVQVKLSSIAGQSNSISARAFVLPRLTKTFRPLHLDYSTWPHLQGLNLADPGSQSSSRVDLIIGADLYGHILLDGLVKGSPHTPVAQNTIFGWVLSGRMDKSHISSSTGSLISFHTSVDSSLINELRRFWEIEEVTSPPPLTPEEKACETHFQTTHSRAPDGRFIVRLPKRPHVCLGKSYSTAVQVLQRSETRRHRDSAYNDAYKLFMQEYLQLGHMEPIPASQDPTRDCYYLPHHAVWKSEGQSQKIRVVFNASSSTSTGNSLNDCLLPGPKLQQDLSLVLLRWRRHHIAFTADIVKMFRQIWVHPEDRDLQRILWRDSPDKKIQEFQLKTVTYGTACAPYLAIRCLHQLAKEGAEQFPEASSVILRQTYVDDILAGADTLEDAVKLKDDLKRLLMAGGFDLAKWASNTSDLACTINEAHPLTDGSVKTLGLQWHPESDSFGFQVTLEKSHLLTKRVILSCTAKLFDPLGWLAPVLLNAKLLIQDLWTTKSDWDATLPPTMETAWIKFYHSLIELQKIRIPRWVHLRSDSTWEIHGFCDASQRAYAAAVYLRVRSPEGIWKSTLLVAKTKVAPLKVLSLPRLELCGAMLLTRLLVQVMDVFQDPPKLYAWTDSQVVLCWLRAHPSRWKCFVANRTSEIHRLIPQAIWNHVSSSDNAADLASRGIPAVRLQTEVLWWHGPSWLSTSDWPSSTTHQTPLEALEEENSKHFLAFNTTCNQTWPLPDRYSSLTRLLRVTAWIRRFLQNCRSTPAARTTGPINTTELTYAQKVWTRRCQSEAFAKEIQALTKNTRIHTGSALLPLRPFLDSENLLRVGGRLEHGALGYGEKHPYILPAKCTFSRLLVQDAHHRVLHGGPQLTLSHLYRRFWIIKGRRLVKDVIHSCVRCARDTAKLTTPLMGQLPTSRVRPSRPFLHTGLDYAGPIQLRTTPGRGYKAYKGYIALFVCMATKAIHLEAVSNYTTSGFLAAFKRFCSRRGIPATISSDQATNFRGADAELRQLLGTASKDNRQIAELLANDGTQWIFIPPHSPHFGGLWEAGIRSVKLHLRRIVGNRSLTFEELTTVLTEIEACLNSRPLTPMSSSPDDFTALTPGHFLIGTPLRTIPEPSLLEVAESRLSRWQLLRRLSEHFWRRWSREYLQQLQQRSKWRTTSENLKVNDLVLITEDNLPPTKWCLGRVTHVHPGTDGIVRVVTLRTATSELQRPVAKLCRLPVDQ